MSKILVDHAPNGMVTLTINRPEARNALDWEAQSLFLQHLRQLAVDSSVRVLIITGAEEKAFCAGGDVVELADYRQPSDGMRLSAGMTEALQVLENAPFPSIAAINGHAIGGGSEIALACDLRIISQQAQLGFVQLSLGLTPGWGAGQRLVRAVGYSRALQIALNAQLITAEVALQWGLVNEIATPNLVLHQAHQWATRIIEWDQTAVAALKRVLRYALLLPHTEAQAAEHAEFAPLWASDAHWQAVEAFLARKR